MRPALSVTVQASAGGRRRAEGERQGEKRADHRSSSGQAGLVRSHAQAVSRAGATGRAVVLLISSIDRTEVTLKIETSLISAR